MKLALITLTSLGLGTMMMAQDFKGKYPETAKGNQVDEFFGEKVNDPYRWLEDDLAADTKNG